MTENDRRREERNVCHQEIDVYLSREPGGEATSQLYYAQLITLSRSGAGIALDEVMSGSTHLAYGPMESDELHLNIVFYFPDDREPLAVATRPIWLNKKQSKDVPPFHVGVEFLEPLSSETFKELNRQCC